MGFCLIDQRGLQRFQRIFRGVYRITNPEPEIGCDLIVARARGMQPSCSITDHISQACLDIHMDVFEIGAKIECTGIDFSSDVFEPSTNCGYIFAGQDAGITQHASMRDGSGDVLSIKRLVKADGSINSFHKRIRRSGKTSTPHPVGPAICALRAVEGRFVAHGSFRFQVRS